MAIKKSETPAKTAGKLVKGAMKGWINKGMADTLTEVKVMPKTNRFKTFAQDVKSGLKGVNAAAGGGLLGKVAAVAQAPNIVGVSAMAQSGYKTRKASGATPGGKKPLFSRDYPLSESPNPEFKNQK
jgi:hypothetical protein